MEDGAWSSQDGARSMEDGGCRMEDGGWRMKDEKGSRCRKGMCIRKSSMDNTSQPPPPLPPSPPPPKNDKHKTGTAVDALTDSSRCSTITHIL